MPLKPIQKKTLLNGVQSPFSTGWTDVEGMDHLGFHIYGSPEMEPVLIEGHNSPEKPNEEEFGFTIKEVADNHSFVPFSDPVLWIRVRTLGSSATKIFCHLVGTNY